MILVGVLIERSVFPPHPRIALRYLRHALNSSGSHAVSEDREKRSGGVRVVGPALACGTPQLEEVGEFRNMVYCFELCF